MGDEAGDGFTHSFAGGDTLADPFIEGVVIEGFGETFESGFIVKAGGVNNAVYGIAETLEDISPPCSVTREDSSTTFLRAAAISSSVQVMEAESLVALVIAA